MSLFKAQNHVWVEELRVAIALTATKAQRVCSNT